MSRAAAILALGSLVTLLLATCSTEVRLGPARHADQPDAAFEAPDAAIADADIDIDAAADAEIDAMPDAEPDAEVDADLAPASDAATSH